MGVPPYVQSMWRSTGMRAYLISLATIACCLTACNRPSADLEFSAAPAPSSSAPIQGLLRLDPAALPDCTPASTVVSWDVGEAAAVTEVDVLVENTGELFAEGGAAGSSETGLWVRPGTTFVLLDSIRRTELARAAVTGPTCD